MVIVISFKDQGCVSHLNPIRVQHDLHSTLLSMQRNRGVSLGPVHTEIASSTCNGDPVCALVIAVYAPQPW
jgi:hypothetical protein